MKNLKSSAVELGFEEREIVKIAVWRFLNMDIKDQRKVMVEYYRVDNKRQSGKNERIHHL